MRVAKQGLQFVKSGVASHGAWTVAWAAVKDDINIIAISFIFAALDAV